MDEAGEDRYFDGLAERLRQRIYADLRGTIRQTLVWEDLVAGVPRLEAGGLRVLDAGGGLGQMSRRLAALGHEVVLAEPSADMLGEARKAIVEEGLEARIRLLQCPVQQLHEQLGEGGFDLVLLHAVLEWLGRPRQTLGQLLAQLRPQGHLSLLFYNRHSLVLRNLIYGNLDKVLTGKLTGYGKKGLTPRNPQCPEEVIGWLDDWGWALKAHTGIRTFYDYMSRADRAEKPMDTVLELERRLARQEPYRAIACYVHLLAQAPQK